jgi:hypothetical protein
VSNRSSDKGRGESGGSGKSRWRLLFVIALLVVAVAFVAVSILSIRPLLDGQPETVQVTVAAEEEVIGESPAENSNAATDGEVAVGRGDEVDGNGAAGEHGSVADEGSLVMRSKSGVGVFTQSPPFVLPASLQPRAYEKGNSIETWEAVSEGSCRDVARDLLLRLRDSGMKLVEAGYLDLFGEAWGCALEDNGEASLTIVLVPEEPFKQRGASNLLRMIMIRTAVPQQDLSAQGTEKER